MPPSQVDQVTALQKRLAALAPSVAPQPLPRVLAAAGNASGGDGALAALQALCTSKRQRRAMESAVLAVRASCSAEAADADDDGAGAISLYGRLDLGRGSFDVHGARMLPAVDASLRSLSGLLEALSAAAHADDEHEEVAEMVRRFAEANGHKAPLAAPTSSSSSSSSSSSRDGGATVLPPSPLLQETVTVAYALQVLIRSAPGLRVTLCGVATPLGATVDVRALVEKLFAAGRQAAAAAVAGEDGEDGDESGGRKKKGKRSKQKRGRGGGDGGGGGGSAAWDLDAAEEAAEEEASQDTAAPAGGDAGKKRKRRKKSKKSAE